MGFEVVVTWDLLVYLFILLLSLQAEFRKGCFVHFKTHTIQSSEFIGESVSCSRGDPYVCKRIHDEQ